jgi:tetratricopeptide (TPR) repeat protein
MFYRKLQARSVSILLFLIAITSTINAQRDRDTWSPSPTFEISGQVRAAENGEAVRNAAVRLERFSGGIVDQITTDNIGRFRFTGLQRGYYTVVVEGQGFNAATQQADLQVLFRAFLMFELTSAKTPTMVSFPLIDARVPAAARDEYLKAHNALSDNKTKDAIPHLEKALLLYPEFLEARLILGTSYMDLRQWEKAESSLMRALDIKGDSAVALLSLGEVYWRQKRYKDAEKSLLDGLKIDDRSWHGQFTLGRLYWDMGDVEKAGPPLGRTLQLKPDFAEAHLLAGNIMLRVGKGELALAEYQEYLRLAPKGEFASQTKELIQKLAKAVAEKKK